MTVSVFVEIGCVVVMAPIRLLASSASWHQGKVSLITGGHWFLSLLVQAQCHCDSGGWYVCLTVVWDTVDGTQI